LPSQNLQLVEMFASSLPERKSPHTLCTLPYLCLVTLQQNQYFTAMNYSSLPQQHSLQLIIGLHRLIVQSKEDKEESTHHPTVKLSTDRTQNFTLLWHMGFLFFL